MLVEMLQTRRGSEDGFTVRQYYAGKTYDMAQRLAADFIRIKAAKAIQEKVA